MVKFAEQLNKFLISIKLWAEMRSPREIELRLKVFFNMLNTISGSLPPNLVRMETRGSEMNKGKNLLPSVEEENAWVHATYETGAVDGPTGKHRPYVDGFSLDEYNSCLRDLHEHVNAALG